MLLKKTKLYFPLIGTLLYLGALIFITYAIVDSDSWSLIQLPDTVYIFYLFFMFVILILGNVTMFISGFNNSIQKKGAFIFLTGIVFLVIFTLIIIVTFFTPSVYFPLIVIFNSPVFYLICILLILILFVAGITLFHHSKIKD